MPGTSDIQLGDKVMLKVHAVKRGTVKKLSNRFEGPYVVAEVRRPDYLIKRGRKKRFVHGSNLKKVHASVCDDVNASDVPCDVDTTQSEPTVEWSGVPRNVAPVAVSAEQEVMGAEAVDVSTTPRHSVSSLLTGVDGDSPDWSDVDDVAPEVVPAEPVYVTRSGRHSKWALRYSP